MRLLITTQAVDLDDPVLGFFHRWLEEFAKHCESVEVICLREGRHRLPQNVRIHSLGAGRIARTARFYRYIWSLRGEYDAVFVHMNPEYVALGGLCWRLWNKCIALWYVHKSVPITLRIAAFFADVIFTAAPESIRLRSKKIHIVGHGIDTAVFSSAPLKKIDTISPRIIVAGRITPIKHLETAIEALTLLRGRGIDAQLDIVGAPTVPNDLAYEKELRALIKQLNVESCVVFRGAVPQSAMPGELARYDIAVNAAPTGGIDKAVLEAMAAGVPVVVCNEAFKEYLGKYPELFFSLEDARSLAACIEDLLKRQDVQVLQERLRELAREHADITALIPRILGILVV